MGQYGSPQVAFILVDGYNVVGSQTDIQDEAEALLVNNHGLGDAWFESGAVGLSKFAMAQKGFYDDAVGNTVDAFRNSNGAQRVFCYAVEGNAIGKRFIGFQAPLQTKVTRLPAIAGLNKLDVMFAANGKVETGPILHPHQVEAGATGNTQATPADMVNDPAVPTIPITAVSVAASAVVSTGVPHGYVTGQIVNIAGTNTTPAINGIRTATVLTATTFSVPITTTAVTTGTGTVKAASSVNGGAGYLEIEALTLGGFTNFAPLVKHSTDNVSYTTLVTFTPATVAPSAQRVAVAPGTTVNEYLAMSWSFGGAGAAQSVKFLVGFVRA